MPASPPPDSPARWVAWVSLVARVILGGALLVAGIKKLLDLRQSVIAVQAYQLPIPYWLETVVGYGLPVVEVLLGGVIIAGLVTRWTAALGGLAMLAYIAVIISVWARGLSIDCGCFTPGGVILNEAQKTTYLQDILRDTGFLVCAVWLVIRPASRLSVDSWLSPDEE